MNAPIFPLQAGKGATQTDADIPTAGGPDGKALSALRRLLNGLEKEEKRSSKVLHLTAYENRLSKLAQSYLASPLLFRQHEGSLEDHVGEDAVRHGSFMFMGLPGVYELERIARDAAQFLFDAALTDFRPVSGLHAMMSTVATASKPGDVIYTIDPVEGGHSASRTLITQLGRLSEYIPWSASEKVIDVEAFEKAIKAKPPAMIFLEHGTPLFPLPLQQVCSLVRSVAGEGVPIVYDASHTLGLIAGRKFQTPLQDGCDVLQGNTHKTFPGPPKALVNFKDRAKGEKISQLLSKGFVSNQHTHHAIATYITMLEMKTFATPYAAQMIENAAALAHELDSLGFALISRRSDTENENFTQSHQVLIRGKKTQNDYDAYDDCKRLIACNISTNARTAFREEVIRIGVQEVTRRGMGVTEMREIAQFFKRSLLDGENIEAVGKDVIDFNEQFSRIYYSFDQELGLN